MDRGKSGDRECVQVDVTGPCRAWSAGPPLRKGVHGATGSGPGPGLLFHSPRDAAVAVTQQFRTRSWLLRTTDYYIITRSGKETTTEGRSLRVFTLTPWQGKRLGQNGNFEE